MKTSLGIWAFGAMATRFNPGRVQARPRRCEHCGEGADGSRGARRPDGRLRVPLPAGALARQPRGGAAGARRPRHLLHRERSPSRPALREGRLLVARRRDARGGAAPDEGGDRPRGRARRAHDHLARDRGLQLPVPDAVRGLVAAVRRRRRRVGATRARPRRDRLPRAQELRAGDEDLHAQHRNDAARDPQAAHRGDRQRAGQHGLAAPDHERREPRRVRGTARSRRVARPPARELRLGDLRRRQHGRRDSVHGDDSSSRSSCVARTTARTASGSASTSTRTPRTPSAPSSARCCSGTSSTASRARSTRLLCARHSRRRTLSAPTSWCTRRSAHSGGRAGRDRRRHDRRQGRRDLAERRRARDRRGGLPALDAPARLVGAGSGGLVARDAGGARAAARRPDRLLRPDARPRHARRRAAGAAPGDPLERPAHRRRSARRSRSASASSG